MSGIDIETKRKLREMGAAPLLEALEAEDESLVLGWASPTGTGRSAIGTLVERSSRSTMLVHLPRLEGWGEQPVVKNGPALGGYGALAMNAALTASLTMLPIQLRQTLTWDRGKELSGHGQLTFDTGTRVFFADPHSPWQRPTNENTNGLGRPTPRLQILIHHLFARRDQRRIKKNSAKAKWSGQLN